MAHYPHSRRDGTDQHQFLFSPQAHRPQFLGRIGYALPSSGLPDREQTLRCSNRLACCCLILPDGFADSRRALHDWILFATFFATLAMYMAVLIAGQPFLARHPETKTSQTIWLRAYHSILGYTLVSSRFGMAWQARSTCCLSLALLPGVYPERLTPLHSKTKPPGGILARGRLTFLAFCVASSSFQAYPADELGRLPAIPVFSRSTQTRLAGNMRAAAAESGGAAIALPAEQWTDRPAILFPLMNMVLWGMGLPLGLAAWAGFALALWQAFKFPGAWRQHLLPLVWGGGFFFFMATRWVKSIRYFLPIYPFFAIFAAFLLFWVLRQPFGGRIRAKLPAWLRALPLALRSGGSLAYSGAFCPRGLPAGKHPRDCLPMDLRQLAGAHSAGCPRRGRRLQDPFRPGEWHRTQRKYGIAFISQEAGVAEGLRFAHLSWVRNRQA